MKLIIFISALAIAAVMFFGCGEKTEAASGKVTKATKELVKTAIGEATDTAKAKAAEAAEKAKVKAKAKAAEAAEAAAEALRK